MRKAPISVIVVACLYIAVGAIALVHDFSHFGKQHPFSYDVVLVPFVHLLAIVSGAFLLRGSNWARWLAVAWMAFHVVVSAFDSWQAAAIHALLCAVIAYVLFRPRASRYFRGNWGAHFTNF